jgi:hypothetical protein
MQNLPFISHVSNTRILFGRSAIAGQLPVGAFAGQENNFRN